MVDASILALGRKVRRAVKGWVRSNPEIDADNMCGACAIASFAMWKTLKAMGHKSNFICAYHSNGNGGHCWVEMDGFVIDLTYTQFRRKAKAVHVISVANQEHSYDKIYVNNRAVKVTKRWGLQDPLGYEGRIKRLVNKLTACSSCSTS